MRVAIQVFGAMLLVAGAACGGGGTGGTVSPVGSPTPGSTTLNVIASVPLPKNASHLIIGPDGTFWMAAGGVDYAVGIIDKVTRSGQVTTYSIGNIVVNGLTIGGDANPWFTANGYVGVVRNGVVSTYQVPDNTQGPGGTQVTTPATGSDGNVYFIVLARDGTTEWLAKVAADGTISETPLTPSGQLWWGYAFFVSGSTLWFSTLTPQIDVGLGSATYQGSAVQNPYQAPSIPPPPNTTDVNTDIYASLAKGGDGRLYFGLEARPVPTGNFTPYLVAYAMNTQSGPQYYELAPGLCGQITAAADGTIWLATCSSVSYFANGTFTGYTIPGHAVASGALISISGGMMWLQAQNPDQSQSLLEFSSSNP